MKRIERREHLKILLGYVSLLLLVVAAFYGVWRQLEVLDRPNGEEQLMALRRSATFDFVLAMHEAETNAVGIGLGRSDDFVRYAVLVDTALARLDTLQRRLTDEPQRARLDTLRRLLVEKRRSVARLTRLMGRSDLVDFYEHQMNAIGARNDSVPTKRVARRVVVQTDSVVRPPERKGFFRRLAEAFVPSKRDSVTVRQEVRDVAIDTLLSHVNPSDTVAGIIGNVQDEARRYRVAQAKGVAQALSRVSRESLAISERANLLLADFDAEEQRLALSRAAEARTLRRQAAFMLAGTTGCALMLAAFFLLLIGRDLQRARRYREDLEAARSRAEHLLRVREQMMLAVTHDLKAPAGAVLGYADLLDRRVGDERSRTYVDSIRRSANHLLALVRSLLDFHKLDAHCVEPDNVVFDVAALFDEVYRAFLPTAEAKGLRLDYVTDIQTRQAAGDPLRLRQMTENLLSNAVKFTQRGTVALRVKAAGGRLTVAVADTGRGIPASELDRLFGEFARMSNAKGEEGFGLGLAITRKNAELLGGGIEVESREGEGSTFTFDVPLAAATASVAPKAVPRQLRVALLDDDVLQLQLCATMLRGEGCEVDCFDTPERLIGNLRDSHYDVLLTDIQMPGLNGFDLVSRLRNDPDSRLHDLRIVAVTARDDIGPEVFRSSGFDACLRKPFSPSSLRACLTPDPGAPAGAPADPAAPQAPAGRWDGLLFYAGGDAEAEADILRTFAGETRQTVRALRQACALRDTRELARLAHKQLPVLRQLGADRLAAAFEVWERQRDGFAWDDGLPAKVADFTKDMLLLADEAEKKANFATGKKKSDEENTVG